MIFLEHSVANGTILTMADWEDVVYGLSDSANFTDLEWPLTLIWKARSYANNFSKLIDDYNCDLWVWLSFLSRVSILTRDIDIANLSVRLYACLSDTFQYQMKTA